MPRTAHDTTASAAARAAAVRLYVGGVRPLPESGRLSGIYKHPVDGPLQLGAQGFEGDQQADLRVHGGPDKAVHLYPARHYARLAGQFPAAAALLQPGSIGENLSTWQLDESQVRIGDVWRLGQALLQPCQPRNPCWKIDERFGCGGMAAFIAEQHIAGWYLRVLRPGVVEPADELRLVEAAAAPSLQQALQTWNAPQPDRERLQELAAMPGIADNWRHKILQRIDRLREQAAG